MSFTLLNSFSFKLHVHDLWHRRVLDRMATRTMNTVLTSCNTPQDQAIVRGLLMHLLEAAGPIIAARKLEDTLGKPDMCDVGLLQTLTVVTLIEHFGMNFGEATAVDRAIFPAGAQPPLIATVSGVLNNQTDY